jgi:hypothetical protein
MIWQTRRRSGRRKRPASRTPPCWSIVDEFLGFDADGPTERNDPGEGGAAWQILPPALTDNGNWLGSCFDIKEAWPRLAGLRDRG